MGRTLLILCLNATRGSVSWDNAGNPLGMTDWTGTWSYDYDSNNRLVGATPPNPVPGQPAGGPYEYDWVGNRLRPPYGTGNEMVYNKADQLIRWPGMYRYSYDNAGNLTQVKNDSETQVVKSYTYTPAGLLDTATFKDKSGDIRTLSNLWDADSNRVSFNVKGTEYELIYDPTAGIPAVIEESAGDVSVYYIREPGGELIARLHPTDGIRYYHFDDLGSTRLLTNSEGNVTDKYSYDAYGSLLSHDCSTGSVNQPYQYVGQLGYYMHWMEPDFGLLQLGVRFYDPEVGRFARRDRVWSPGTGSYVYVVANPLISTDAKGLSHDPIDGVASFKLCYRRVKVPKCCGGKATADFFEIDHAYLLIDGVPIGYGPGGAGQIDDDWADLEAGRARCHKPWGITPTQLKCLRKIKDNPGSVPGNWRPGTWGSKKGGCYFPGFHDCYDYATAALESCGVSGSMVCGWDGHH